MIITKGNTINDGREFRCWFVGQIDKWCSDKGIPFDPQKYGLRNTEDLEVKWGVYKKGDVRTDWALCTDMIGMSILLRGDCIFKFREANDHDNCEEVRLIKEGDYVIWREDVEHTWQMLEDSVFLTLRWQGKH